MKRTRLFTLVLAVMLLAFIVGVWGGLAQWWRSLPPRRRLVYLLCALCFAGLVLSHLLA